MDITCLDFVDGHETSVVMAMSLIEAFLADQSRYAVTLAFDTHVYNGLTSCPSMRHLGATDQLTLWNYLRGFFCGDYY